ncbi:spermidine synthase [Marinobacterium weihaiense]|uniref:Fused MFS/spermidine synthase n=1 Tax=Marinobacterium weihaiense TaxID=2851016 RepID=A0ABS6MBJ8_9GAMM|nr:fused MFS/spermidine synthase [Marinobacterium weihaiense]MBV0933681.1 fused MFS/spermidine synthase [Marinobacterium weihaiense]
MLPGQEIYRGHDTFGSVRVLDDGDKRYLAFGDLDEQSCCLKHEPLIPEHEYVRAMLLVLLFAEPKQVISLGLGAGALNTCLHGRFAGCKQQVAELRAEVIEVAYRFFQLPRGKRLQIHATDALDFLRNISTRKADIIFSDIYGADGLSDQQLGEEYLELCARRLKPGGWLVMNLWRDHQGPDTLELLLQQFGTLYGCHTQSGNWVVLASEADHDISQNQLDKRARQLGQQLGFSLSPHLKRLRAYP